MLFIISQSNTDQAIKTLKLNLPCHEVFLGVHPCPVRKLFSVSVKFQELWCVHANGCHEVSQKVFVGDSEKLLKNLFINN